MNIYDTACEVVSAFVNKYRTQKKSTSIYSGVMAFFHNYAVVVLSFMFLLGFRCAAGGDSYSYVNSSLISCRSRLFGWKRSSIDGNSGVLAQCYDLDRVGGQPVYNMDVSKKVSLWVESTLPDKPTFYQYKIVVNQHRIGRALQDSALSTVAEYKKILQYIGEQYELLGLPQKRIDEIKQSGQLFMSSKEWKNLCERDVRRGNQAASKLGSLFTKVVDQMEISLNEILIAKKQMHAEYVNASLQNAQKVAEAKNAIRAERIKAMKISEERKRKQEEEEERLQAAARERQDEERREANRRGENGLELQRQQFRNDTLATEAFLHVMKEVKKGNRKSEDLSGVGRSAVAE